MDNYEKFSLHANTHFFYFHCTYYSEFHTMKTCTKCRIEKPKNDYYKCSRNKSGIISQCKSCKDKIVTAWQRKNPESKRISSLKQYYKNHEKKKALAREYKANNQDKLKQNMQAWRAGNREYTRRYYEENKAWFKTWNANRRAQIDKATVRWANFEKIKDIYEKAMKLTKETGIQHHVDHIIPINSKYVCGLHVEYNLQILTEQENLSKSNKFTPG